MLLLVAYGVVIATLAPQPTPASTEEPDNTASAEEKLEFHKFGEVMVQRGEATPTFAVLLASGAGGWDATMQALSDDLVAEGALVIGFSTPHLMKELAGAKDKCAYPAADFEALSHYT